jgi:hypothetical protein
MGAAVNSQTCRSIVLNQVSSVGQLALNVATFGGAAAATGAMNASENASRLAQLKEQFSQLQSAYEAAKESYPALQTAETTLNRASQVEGVRSSLNQGYKTFSERVTAEDIARAAAQIAAAVDSTGISATVGAYTYPKCSQYFGAAR